MRFKLISFDFDHTLTCVDSALEHVAKKLGIEREIALAESDFKAGRIDTRAFTDRTATLFSGHCVDAIADHMDDIALLPGTNEMMARLRELGIDIVINSVGYRSLLLPLRDRLAASDVSGVELDVRDGRFTGRVDRYFPLSAKIDFTLRHCQRLGCDLSEVIAVGDGLSDVPLFQAVGASVAFNADPKTQSMATAAADGVDVTGLGQVLKGLLNGSHLQ